MDFIVGIGGTLTLSDGSSGYEKELRIHCTNTPGKSQSF
jgi:hypothetical protein